MILWLGLSFGLHVKCFRLMSCECTLETQSILYGTDLEGGKALSTVVLNVWELCESKL